MQINLAEIDRQLGCNWLSASASRGMELARPGPPVVHLSTPDEPEEVEPPALPTQEKDRQ